MAESAGSETTPLLSKPTQKSDKDAQSVPLQRAAARSEKRQEILRRHLAAKGFAEKKTDPDDRDNDVINYRNRSLATWKAFNIGPNSVWRSTVMWSQMFSLGVVALVTAILTVAFVPDPAALQVSKFTEISKFLNILIGLMLGFFLASSTKRWYNCVDGFLALLDAVRNLQMQNQALGVPKDRSLVISRYGIASAWLLFASLLTRGESMTEAWELFKDYTVGLDDSGPMRLLSDKEIESLKKYRDPPGMMWMCIANLVSKLSQDGFTPPMQSPTYGRLMDLCQKGHNGIRIVRAAICVQAPLPYPHALAILVHCNNLLNALVCGLVFGTSFGTVMVRYGLHVYVGKVSGNDESQAYQMIGVNLLYSVFGPILYQGLLMIGFHLAQPFEHEDTSVPLDLFLHRLEVDIRNGNEVCDRIPVLIPSFQMPVFKAPPKA
jgi:predicted membrane chloride channel (bestrophin family)